MAKKKKTLLEKAADAVDHVLHPGEEHDEESSSDESEESAEVESSEDLADQSDVKEEPIVHTTGETVLGKIGDEKFDADADQDHSKFDKFK